jgi:steroid delta-isomerase-like uncharacterized protein
MSDAATVHREYFDTIKTRDFDRMRVLLHPDYTIMQGDGLEQKGPDVGIAIAETYVTAFPDLSFEIRHQYAPSDTVSVLEFTARGTHQAPLEDIPATGRAVEIVVCNVIEVEDGKILREREYYDNLAIMRQLGVVD